MSPGRGGGGGLARNRGGHGRADGDDGASATHAEQSQVRTIPNNEYYGSMAVGSIVGALRSRGEPAGSGVPARPRPAQSGASSRASRREPRASNATKPEQHCRSTLVPRQEGQVSLPEACLHEDGLPILVHGAGERPAAIPARPVWLALTTNTITAYESASRRERLAAWPLRSLCLVDPLPAATSSYIHRRGDAPETGFGIALCFVASLPPTARPPSLPFAMPLGVPFRTAVIYLPTVEKQQHWLVALRQAADPKPPAPAVVPSHPTGASAPSGVPTVSGGAWTAPTAGVGQYYGHNHDLALSTTAGALGGARQTALPHATPSPVPASPAAAISMGSGGGGPPAALTPALLPAAMSTVPTVAPPPAATAIGAASNVGPPSCAPPIGGGLGRGVFSRLGVGALNPALATSLDVLPAVPPVVPVLPIGRGGSVVGSLGGSQELLPVVPPPPSIPLLPRTPIAHSGSALAGASPATSREILPSMPPPAAVAVAAVPAMLTNPWGVPIAATEADVDENDPLVKAVEAVAVDVVSAVVTDDD